MSPTDTAPLLAVSGLQKSFGTNRVLDGVDLEVRRGDVLVLIGPRARKDHGPALPERPRDPGCRCGGVRRGTGRGLLAQGVQERPHRLRDRSAMVFQHHNLFPHLTVIQNVIEGPIQAHGVPKAEAIARAETLLARVGLSEKRDAYPSELSGGQQQRVGIVRALALQPSLLLFDEPTSALDPELVGEVLTVLRELANEGWTMVIVTHELGFAREVADEVLFFDEGVIVERGAPSELLRQPKKERTQRFLNRLLRPLDGPDPSDADHA